MELARWQDYIIDIVEIKEEDNYQDERIEENNWLDGVESQIESIGQACLGY